MNEVPTCLIEKNSLFREGLRSLLLQSNFTPLIELPHIEYLDNIKSHDGSRLIIVSSEQSIDGIVKFIRAVKQKNCKTYVVVLSEVADREMISACFSAEVDGFLLKNISASAFIASLNLVMTGEKVFPTSMASVITSGWGAWLKHNHISQPLDPQFSERERDIIEHLAEGRSNKLIANSLNITEATVKVHLKTVLRKLKFSNRTQIAIWAVRNGSQQDTLQNHSMKLR